MPRFAAGLEYDGRAYSGWQFQPGLQHRSGRRAARACRASRMPRSNACARGAPMRACMRSPRWSTSTPTPCAASAAGASGANTYLPADVSVAWLREVPGHFHARFSALARSYRYLILNRDSRPALAARARHLGTPAARRGAHARGRAGAGRRTRLQRVPRDRMPGEIPGAPRRAPRRSRATAEWVTLGDHRQRLPASHGAQCRRAADVGGHGRVRRPNAWPRCSRAAIARCNAATAPPDGLYLAAVRYPAEFGLPGTGRADAGNLPQSVIIGRTLESGVERQHVLVRENHALADQDRAPHAFGPRRPVDQVLGLRRRAVPRRARAQSQRLPEVQPSHAHRRARAAGALPRRRRADRDRRRHLARGSAQVPRQQALPRPPRRGAEGHRRARRADRRSPARSKDSRSSPAPSNSSSSAARWARWSASASSAPSITASRPRAAGVFLLERRRAHAGGVVLAAADGQDQRRAGAARAGAAAVHLRDDRSDHRRRVREPRDARRSQRRRAARAHRFRRARASSSRPCARPCPKDSSAASSCSITARSTSSSIGATCARSSARCCAC